jgi:hypothetical protein
LLNIIAGSLSVGVTPSTNSYESIATYTVGAGGQSTITFSSIPSTFAHLQLRYIARSAQVGNASSLILRFNSDSSSNYYAYHEIYADGATAAAYADSTATLSQIDQIPAANKTASVFGVGVVDLLDYTSTSKNKTLRFLDGWDANGSGAVVFGSSLYKPSTIAAISTITITDAYAQNFAQYSSFALYGIKGV